MAYEDTALPIGFDQTISQPYIVALMTAAMELSSDQKVLEVGTGVLGSGIVSVGSADHKRASIQSLCRSV